MSVINLKDHSYAKEHLNSSKSRYFSCHDPDVDEDLEELAQASIDDVKDELATFSYNSEQLLQKILIDLEPDPKVVSMSTYRQKNYSRNYFSDAFAILQEAVFESIYNKRYRFWKLWNNRVIISGVFASILALSFTVSLLLSSPSLDKQAKSIAFLEPSTSQATQPLAKIKNKQLYSDTEKKFDSLSNIEKAALMQIVYEYIKKDGKFAPTKETNDALANLAGYSQATSYPTLIKASSPSNICSDDGFYSYIVKDNDTFSTIAHRCGFTYSELDERQDLPTLNIGDVIHFNFDQKNHLTKATIYKDNNFYIMAFDQGKLIKKPILGDEKSIIVRLEIKEGSNIFEELGKNPDLKDKNDLWKKVADRLSHEYSENIIKSRVKGDQKYFINIKYVKNHAKNHYEVVNTSLFEDKYGS